MRIKPFTIILGISSLSIAGIAAYFSISGLGKLYSGAMQEVILMAGVLEVGKLIGVSWLYRNWKRRGERRGLKIYFACGISGLMILTSLGIYGFLSAAYQSSTIVLQMQQDKIELKKDQYDLYVTEKDRLLFEKKSIETVRDNELAGMVMVESTRYYDAKQRQNVFNRYKPYISEKQTEINALTDSIIVLQTELSDMRISVLKTGVDVGPIVFVSKTFNVPIDSVANFITIFIIFLFDPFAVALMIAYNMELEDNIKRKKEMFIDNENDISLKSEMYMTPERKLFLNDILTNYKLKHDISTDIENVDIKSERVLNETKDPEIYYGRLLDEEIYVEPITDDFKNTDVDQKKAVQIKETIEAIFDETERQLQDDNIKT